MGSIGETSQGGSQGPVKLKETKSSVSETERSQLIGGGGGGMSSSEGGQFEGPPHPQERFEVPPEHLMDDGGQDGGGQDGGDSGGGNQLCRLIDCC